MSKLHSKSDIIDRSFRIPCLVGTGRLELPRIAPYAPEAYAYTNSATCPRMYYKNSTVFNNRFCTLVLFAPTSRLLATSKTSFIISLILCCPSRIYTDILARGL